MCRFLFYTGSPVVLSDLLFEPINSIIQQSFKSREREEPLNGDGFGVAWYQPSCSAKAGVFRSVTPAWSNKNLARLSHVTTSSCVMAHVRAASEGLSVSEDNCHPFVRGPLTFMHNGDLAGFAEGRRKLLAALSDASFYQIHGTTDSEFLFALFLDAYDLLDRHQRLPPGVRLARALAQSVRKALALIKPFAKDKLSYFNICVSDGVHAAASRIATPEAKYAESLHVHTGGMFKVVRGHCRMLAPKDGHGAVIIASEQLSNDRGWHTVPPNHIVVVHTDQKVSIEPFKVFLRGPKKSTS